MQKTAIEPAFDYKGRALPLSSEEELRRADEAIRAIDALAETDDEAEQRDTFKALVEAIDGDRLSDRRRFSE